jgi:hypothetical protein
VVWGIGLVMMTFTLIPCTGEATGTGSNLLIQGVREMGIAGLLTESPARPDRVSGQKAGTDEK